ncbi:hypothetical protein Are01nite_86580 [Actinoplanes regularis]|nr:hypothetical protein Are01nite_86580 [Actinoplanes regularis]
MRRWGTIELPLPPLDEELAVTTDVETWQLGHRTEEASGQALARWDRHPVTVVRPAKGVATGRFLCMTCDEAVDYVAASTRVRNRRLRWRRWRARAGCYAGRFLFVMMVLSAISPLPPAVLMATRGEWLLAFLLLPFTALYGWFATVALPYVHYREPAPRDDEKVRLATRSPVHELRS